MKTTKRQNNRIGNGLSRDAFADDGIPNSPFKSSKSAALTFAIFGITLGGLFVVSGAVMASSQAHKSVPVQVVQQEKASTVAAPKVAMSVESKKRSVNPARTKRHQLHHAKSTTVPH